MTRSQNASFHQTSESAQIICDRILWTASQVIADSSASLVRLTRPRESSPLTITNKSDDKKKTKTKKQCRGIFSNSSGNGRSTIYCSSCCYPIKWLRTLCTARGSVTQIGRRWLTNGLIYPMTQNSPKTAVLSFQGQTTWK